jgi:hypothetical protein
MSGVKSRAIGMMVATMGITTDDDQYSPLMVVPAEGDDEME